MKRFVFIILLCICSVIVYAQKTKYIVDLSYNIPQMSSVLPTLRNYKNPRRLKNTRHILNFGGESRFRAYYINATFEIGSSENDLNPCWQNDDRRRFYNFRIGVGICWLTTKKGLTFSSGFLAGGLRDRIPTSSYLFVPSDVYEINAGKVAIVNSFRMRSNSLAGIESMVELPIQGKLYLQIRTTALAYWNKESVYFFNGTTVNTMFGIAYRI